MLRNSSSIHEGDNKCPEYVYLRKNSDSFLGDVADTFSPDVTGFLFCNTPIRNAAFTSHFAWENLERWSGRASWRWILYCRDR